MGNEGVMQLNEAEKHQLRFIVSDIVTQRLNDENMCRESQLIFSPLRVYSMTNEVVKAVEAELEAYKDTLFKEYIKQNEERKNV